MIRKNAIPLILAVVVVLAILVAFAVPAFHVDSANVTTAGWHTDTILADTLPTPTPGGGGNGTDSNPSGGGNTGG